MKMELIQPFINAADAVLAQGLQCSTSVGHLSMEEEAYRRHGVAAEIYLTGDIEGRIILDLAPETAVRVASHYAGAEVPESDDLVRETVCELANQITGNAVTALNDQGFHFRVHPPVLHTSEHGAKKQRGYRGARHEFRDRTRKHVYEYCATLQPPTAVRTCWPWSDSNLPSDTHLSSNLLFGNPTVQAARILDFAVGAQLRQSLFPHSGGANKKFVN